MKAIGERARYTGKVQLTKKNEQEYRTLATSPPTVTHWIINLCNTWCLSTTTEWQLGPASIIIGLLPPKICLTSSPHLCEVTRRSLVINNLASDPIKSRSLQQGEIQVKLTWNRYTDNGAVLWPELSLYSRLTCVTIICPSQQSVISRYQYVSVPIPTTPQVIRPKVHYRQHGDTLILPKLIKAIGDRARYTEKVQLTLKKMSRSIEHWQRLHQLDHWIINLCDEAGLFTTTEWQLGPASIIIGLLPPKICQTSSPHLC